MRSGTRAPFSALRNKKSGRPKDENDDARKKQLSLSLSRERAFMFRVGGFEGGDALYNPISLLRSLSLFLLDIIPKETHTTGPFDDDDLLKQRSTKNHRKFRTTKRDGLLKCVLGPHV